MNSQVSKDLSLWLQQHNKLNKKALFEETPALKKLYQQIYTGVTGLTYTEQEAKSLLPMAIMKGDVDTIKKILDNNKEIDLNDGFPNINYRGSGEQTIFVSDLLQDIPIKSLYDLIMSLKDRAEIKEIKLKAQSIDDEDIHMIKNILNLPKFKNISLLVGNLDLKEILRENTEPLELDFHDKQLGNEGAKNLAIALKYQKNLKSLNLQNCDITGEGVKFLADALKDRNDLISLNLSYNNLDIKTIQLLFDALKDRENPIELYMSNDYANCIEILKLYNSISHYNLLKSLKLIFMYTGFDHEGNNYKKDIMTIFNPDVKNFIFSDMRIDSERAKILSKIISNRKNIEVLEFSACEIDEDGIILLANAIENQINLKSLILDSNIDSMTDKGLISIITAMQNKNILEELVLSLNLNEDQFQKINEALKNHANFDKFDLY